MQRNILKIALACGMALLLSAVPAQSLNAAENIAESTIDTDAQSANASELHETYYVNAQNGLKMRSAPSKDSDVITLLPYGAEVTVIGTSNNSWCEIEYLNESGYVAANYITRSDDAESDDNDDIIEEEESIPSTALSSEGIQTTPGVTPIIFALIAAIIIMILLAIYTAYSFLKKDKNSYDNENDENDADDNSNDDDYDDVYDDNYYDDDNESNEYTHEEYYDDEYYDEEYYCDEE